MSDETALPQAIRDELYTLRARVVELERLLAERSHTNYQQEAEQLRSIVNSLGDIVWSQDPVTWEVIYLSPAIETIYGYPAEAFVADPELWIKIVHPEDTHLVEAHLPTIMERGNSDVEYRIIRPDGEVRWIHDRGNAVNDGAGTIIRIDGLATDITARKRFEAEQDEQRQRAELIRTQEQVIEAQRSTLRELSTPLIPLAQGVIALPLIGTIDDARAEQMLETLLNGIMTQQADIAIIDITGVPMIDTQVANALLRAARAASLIGAQVVLTGIKPEVAQTLVHLGADLGALITRSTLQSGIDYALGRRG